MVKFVVASLVLSLSIQYFYAQSACQGSECQADEASLIQTKVQHNVVNAQEATTDADSIASMDDDGSSPNDDAVGAGALQDEASVPEPVHYSNEDPLGVECSILARDVYGETNGSDVAAEGWTKAVSTRVNFTTEDADIDLVPDNWVPGADNIGLYVKNGTCVLGFEGSSIFEIADWFGNFGNFNTTATEGCGAQMHGGFFAELTHLMRSDQWRDEIMPVLTTDFETTCPNGLVTTGHSKGGALAVIFAYCANAGQLHTLSDNMVGVSMPLVSKVYTYGAPAVAFETLLNESSKAEGNDGVIQGIRYYNNDATSYDPVSVLSVYAGYHHPLMASEKLHASWLSVLYSQLLDPDCPCDNATGWRYPCAYDHFMDGEMGYCNRLHVLATSEGYSFNAIYRALHGYVHFLLEFLSELTGVELTGIQDWPVGL